VATVLRAAALSLAARSVTASLEPRPSHGFRPLQERSAHRAAEATALCSVASDGDILKILGAHRQWIKNVTQIDNHVATHKAF
jgi:hypothetical protein